MIEKNEIISKLKELKPLYSQEGFIIKGLFGSYSTNNATAQSDIDILVDLDYSQKIGLHFIQMKIDLEKILNKEVDLVSSNGLSKYIKPIIDNEKELIYAK